jgi:hypothetical protein
MFEKGKTLTVIPKRNTLGLRIEALFSAFLDELGNIRINDQLPPGTLLYAVKHPSIRIFLQIAALLAQPVVKQADIVQVILTQWHRNSSYW